MSDTTHSKGCLFVVACHTDTLGPLDAVLRDVDDRLLLSPALADFIEFRSVDLGPRPPEGANPSEAVARLAGELTRPVSGAGENYFGLVVIDRSAAGARRLLDGCLRDPVIAALPLRARGIAGTGSGEPRADGIVPPPPAGWSHDTLVAELRRYADELLAVFAGAPTPGLGRDGLARLRAVLTPAAPANGGPADGGPADGGPADGGPADAGERAPGTAVVVFAARVPAAEVTRVRERLAAIPGGMACWVLPEDPPAAAPADSAPADSAPGVSVPRTLAATTPAPPTPDAGR